MYHLDSMKFIWYLRKVSIFHFPLGCYVKTKAMSCHLAFPIDTQKKTYCTRLSKEQSSKGGLINSSVVTKKNKKMTNKNTA